MSRMYGMPTVPYGSGKEYVDCATCCSCKDVWYSGRGNKLCRGVKHFQVHAREIYEMILRMTGS